MKTNLQSTSRMGGGEVTQVWVMVSRALTTSRLSKIVEILPVPDRFKYCSQDYKGTTRVYSRNT